MVDLITHAIVGYFVGGAGGIIGASVPDLSMIGHLWKAPEPEEPVPPLYHYCHSLLFVAIGFFLLGSGFALGNLSHLILDQFTHDERMAPRWLYPWKWHIGTSREWHFLNHTWWEGVMVAVCLIISSILLTNIGYL